VKVFFDTSAFAKRYVEEPRTNRVIEFCSRADAVGLSVICLPEMVSALCRLVREKKLRRQEYENMREIILADLEDADICDITSSVLTHALRCLENNALRALDAIQLGCALAYAPDLFVSSDRRQIKAARSEGLTVIEV
jgi:predicted nucleic acid-binding protein